MGFNNQQQSPLVTVGSGWNNKSSSGNSYVSMKFNQPIQPNTNLSLFRCQQKERENSPDYYISGKESDGYRKQNYGGGGGQQGGGNRQGGGGFNVGGGQGNGQNAGFQGRQNTHGNGYQSGPRNAQGDDLSADPIPF